MPGASHMKPALKSHKMSSTPSFLSPHARMHTRAKKERRVRRANVWVSSVCIGTGRDARALYFLPFLPFLPFFPAFFFPFMAFLTL